MTRDDCLIEVVPFFVLPISPSPIPAYRAALRAAERAVRADCLPRNRSAAHDTTQSANSLRDDTSRRANSHFQLINRYHHIESGTVASYHDGNSFPPHAPHMRHGERGELTAVCLPIRLVSTRYGGGNRHIPHRGNQIGRIRFAHFPWMANFPVAMSHRCVII